MPSKSFNHYRHNFVLILFASASRIDKQSSRPLTGVDAPAI